MSDARYDTYQHYGTNAERLAFVPDPPSLTGVQPIYIWFETDTLETWVYYTAWALLAGSGGGAPAAATYLTEDDETATLTNSRQVLAGTGISFDDTVPNVRTINASAGSIQPFNAELDDTDIKALPTTPFSLIAAPGADKIIVPINIFNYVDCNAGAYTNIDSGGWAAVRINGWDICSYIGDTDTSGVDANLAAILGAVNDHGFAFIPQQQPSLFSGWWLNVARFKGADLVNQPLTLEIDNNGSGNLTGGNAANVWKLSGFYYVMDLS